MMIRKAFLAINVFLVAILIVMGISTICSLSGVARGVSEEPRDDSRTASILRYPVKPLSHYSIIGQRDLFGSPPPEFEQAEETPESIESLPRTALRLRLKGTVCSIPSFSYAVIEDLSSRREELYRLGDMVAGARIVRIERNQVVIERRGNKEVLAAYEEGMLAWEGGEEISPLYPPTRTSRSGPMVLGEKEMVAATEAASMIMERLQLDRQNLSPSPSDLTEAVSGANQALTETEIKPCLVDGKLEGFQVVEIQPGSIYERIGLRPGDIIEDINGYQINSIQNAFQVYEMLQKESVIIVSVERDGQPVTLIYEIKGLMKSGLGKEFK